MRHPALMVFSSLHFVETAVAAGKPVAEVNLGSTSAGGLPTQKVAKPAKQNSTTGEGMSGGSTPACERRLSR
jgi:hypothetical protein